jgi:hypothetical protein
VKRRRKNLYSVSEYARKRQQENFKEKSPSSLVGAYLGDKITGNLQASDLFNVLGASSGIGRATAELFASLGASIAITGRSEKGLEVR